MKSVFDVLKDDNYVLEHTTATGRKIKVLVTEEVRKSHRISFKKGIAYIKLSKFDSSSNKKNHITRFLTWLDNLEQKRPALFEALGQRVYRNLEIIHLYGDAYQIHINLVKGQEKIRREGDKVLMYVKENRLDKEGNLCDEMVSKAMQRIFTRVYLPKIKEQVNDLNRQFFQEEIGAVRLKYTSSRWGSCSAKRNINLSSRLLWAPPECLHAVIIHELAHLKEMNHSKQFWNWVFKAMPDYKKHHNWLKQNGSQCNF